MDSQDTLFTATVCGGHERGHPRCAGPNHAGNTDQQLHSQANKQFCLLMEKAQWFVFDCEKMSDVQRRVRMVVSWILVPARSWQIPGAVADFSVSPL